MKRFVAAGVVVAVLLAGCGPVGGVEADKVVADSLLAGGEHDWMARAAELAGEAAGVVTRESVSAQDVRGFYERFGSVFDSAVFARALAERVEPGVLADFAVKVAEYQGSFETGDGRDVAGEVVAGLGAVAVLSTGGVLVGQDQGPLSEVSVSEVERRVGQWRVLGGSRGFDGVGQMFSAAGQRYPMLVAGPEFVSGVVPAVLEWDFERGNAPEVGWFSAKETDDVVGALLSVMDEPAPVTAEAGWVRLDAVQEVLAGDTPFDVDMNEGLARVPRLSFYEEGKAPVGPMSVARYLVGHRFVEGFKVGADGGEALGRVLAQAASVGRVPQDLSEGDPGVDVWRGRQKRSTVIAGSALLGFQEGLEVKASRVKGQSAFSAANAGLLSWMGEILAPHVNNIAKSLHLYYPPIDWENPFLDFLVPDENRGFILSDLMVDRLNGPEGLFVELRFDQPEVDDGGTPQDSSDDVYPRGRIPASERLVLASLERYHEQLLREVIEPQEFTRQSVAHAWARMFDALLGDGAPAQKDAIDVTAELNERVAWLRAGYVENAPVAEGKQRQMLDQIQASPWTREAVPTFQAVFPQEKGSVDDADVSGQENRIDLLGKGFFVALAADPQFLQKYPHVREAMSADLLGDNQMLEDEDAPGSEVVLPAWLENTSVPMPKLEEMTERERIAFMSAISDDARLSNFFKATTGETINQK